MEQNPIYFAFKKIFFIDKLNANASRDASTFIFHYLRNMKSKPSLEKRSFQIYEVWTYQQYSEN